MSGTESSGRQVAARQIPIPPHVSAELKASIAASKAIPVEVFARAPATPEQWWAMKAANSVLAMERIGRIRARCACEIRAVSLGGVAAFEVVPKIPTGSEAAQFVLMHLHGGAYVINTSEAGLAEAILAAHYSGARIISIDYRTPPEHPFPAAVEDAVAAFKALAQAHGAGAVGVFGTSAGAGLALAMTLRLKDKGLPLPGALAPSSPWTDLSGLSDSYSVNAGVDGVLPVYAGLLEGCARLYAGDARLDDPLVSPINGDVTGFPPCLLTTGTRDLLLSDTVRMHRRLRDAGVYSRLEVYEAMSHAEFNQAFESPESASIFRDLAAFFAETLKPA